MHKINTSSVKWTSLLQVESCWFLPTSQLRLHQIPAIFGGFYANFETFRKETEQSNSFPHSWQKFLSNLAEGFSRETSANGADHKIYSFHPQIWVNVSAEFENELP